MIWLAGIFFLYGMIEQPPDLAQAAYRSIFYSEPLRPERPPADLAARLQEYDKHWRAYRSRLGPGPRRPGPELALDEKRRAVEHALAALVPGAEAEAAEAVRGARLFYEWEGMSEGPRTEAEWAEAYLRGHPGTGLAPYLRLFAADRLRSAAECPDAEDRPGRRAELWRAYRRYLDLSLSDPDPLIRLAAAGMERRPFLYLQAAGAVGDAAAWVRARCAAEWGAASGQGDQLEEFAADLDGDGAQERLLTCEAARGNGGSTWYAFRRQRGAESYMGSLFLHRRAFRAIPAAGGGRPALWIYVRGGAGEGLLEKVVWNGREFETLSKEPVEPLGRDAARLRDLFGEAFGPAAGEELSRAAAMEIAARWLAEHRPDLAGQHLAGVTIQNGPGGAGRFWLLQWAWDQPRMGGEFSLTVRMDGRVEARRLGP